MMVSRTWIFVAAFVVIVTGNVTTLYGVYRNHQQEEVRLRLSEREVSLYGYGEDALSLEGGDFRLRLAWRKPVDSNSEERNERVVAAWLKSETLAELGFSPTARHKYRQHQKEIVRRAFIVLEFDGPAYQAALEYAKASAEKEQAKCLKKQPSDEQSCCDETRDTVELISQTSSRLFVVDAGIDADRLRRQYPDSNRYAIVRGTIWATYWSNDVLIGRSPSKDPIRPDDLRVKIDSETIYVPLELRPPLEAMIKNPNCRGETCPGFEIDLVYGTRFEPWLVNSKATVVAKGSSKKHDKKRAPETVTEHPGNEDMN